MVYQIYPRSFADSDGDGVGDLEGARRRLAYVAALGAEAVWLSPVFRSPMVDNGYDVSDHCDIDPAFGDLADFDAFLADAHRLGLKVILDQVYSHTSDRHPWFEQSRCSREGPFADWYVWADPAPGGGPPNNWQCWFGETAWTWEPRRGQYYLHNFHPRMPDLNFLTPAVLEAVLGVARFWIGRGVDGLRLDVCNYWLHDAQLRDNPPNPVRSAAKPFFLQKHVYNCDQPGNLANVAALRAVLDAGGCAAVAEICSDDNVEQAVAYTSGPHGLHTAYSFAFLADWPGAAGFRRIMEAYEETPEAWPSFAFSNHDIARVATRWSVGDDWRASARLFLALLLSLRGTIFLYQGQELGLPESEVPFERLTDPSGLAGWPLYKGRDGCRTPFPWDGAAPFNGFSTVEPWLPVDPAHAPLSASAQTGDPGSAFELTRRLLAWRRESSAVREAPMAFIEAPDPVIAFRRGDEALCVFNAGPAPAAAPLPPSVGAPVFAERASRSGEELWLGPWGWAILRGD